MRVAAWLVVLGMGLGLTARGGGSPAQAGDRAFTVAAAADLSAALPEVNRAFERKTGVQATAVLGSSGQLRQQIEAGAPYDVFLSANAEYVDFLVKQGLVDRQSRRVYAVGRLALVVNRRSGVQAARPRDLLRRQIHRIAIANPDHAPYGKAAREALQRSGVWSSVEKKVVLADNVRQALQFVQTGNAEAGLVALPTLPVPEVTHTLVDRNLHAPILQTAGVVKRGPFVARAGEYLEFLAGAEAQGILGRYGFEPPPAPPGSGAPRRQPRPQ